MSFDSPNWPPAWPEIDAAIQRVVRSGDWGRYHSEICGQLQARLQADLGVDQVRLSCSGTAALETALRAAQVGPGDAVALAAYDFPGNFRTIELLGARPILLDLESDSLSIDPVQLEDLGSQPDASRIRGVIASHLYGRAADVQRLHQICHDRGWILIEDACQAVGMRIGERMAGTFGDFATLSFGGSKPISAGGGGAVLANSSRLAARLGGLLDRPGEVFPLSPLQAAVIEPQWDRLDELCRIRLATVEFLQNEVNERLCPWVWQSEIESGTRPSYYKVAWLAASAEQRNRVIAAAQEEGLPVGPGFRSMSGCSDRRCGKPFPTPRSDLLGQRLFVLDHRALMLSATNHPRLAESLLRLASATRSYS